LGKLQYFVRGLLWYRDLDTLQRVTKFIVFFSFGLSEVRALPVRRCRWAALQTKWPLNSLFFFSSSSLFLLLLYLITFLSEGVVLGSWKFVCALIRVNLDERNIKIFLSTPHNTPLVMGGNDPIYRSCDIGKTKNQNDFFFCNTLYLGISRTQWLHVRGI
jgi:hypothetical protein